MKLRWFVCLLEDTACMLQYIGSTTDVCSSRWSSTKSARNKEGSVCTGMYKHVKEGCPNDTGREKDHLRLTMIDYMEEWLIQSEHQPGPQCTCGECLKLLRTENKWILRLVTFHGQSGLNTRDEVKSAVRRNYKQNRT